jgi:hypothetical protein
MIKKELSSYEVLVRVAYGFYITVGLVWLLMSLFIGHYFSYQAFIVLAIFSAQAWYKHLLTNLILGVLLIGISIFCALEFMLMGGKTGFDLFVNIMMATCILSIIMSGILIFSYMKLNFKDR